MNLSVYDITIPQYITSLEALKNITKKGHDHFSAKKVDFSVVMQTRLAPDQFPFVKQVQIATDNAKALAARLTQSEAPKFEDNEKSYEDLQMRLDKTISYLKTVNPEKFAGWEKLTVSFPWYPGHHLSAKDYVIQHALPNFYFHVTTAYAILRENGVDVGKGDFLGAQNWKKD